MMTGWTFGQKLVAGFALTVALAIVSSVLATMALRTVVASKDRVLSYHAQNLIDAETLHSASEARAASNRAFLFTGEREYLEDLKTARQRFVKTIEALKLRQLSEDLKRTLDDIQRASDENTLAVDSLVRGKQSGTPNDELIRQYNVHLAPHREDLNRAIDVFAGLALKYLEDAKAAATADANAAIEWLVLIMIGVVGVAAVVAVILPRTLSRQLGTAVQHVQSSSAELQASANQQATGAREQATAMNEITATINELLVTSRQIAESAQRVAQMAQQTADASRGGEQSVQSAQDALGSIQKQVDLIVTNMLELGRKSQQIGGILEIINELSDQTNILAINATIESAGAGEAGKRFAVVADEIRKLADRVTSSTKEIRTLVEDIRGSVNATVMVTEGGSKAVEEGTRLFKGVNASFKQIASLVKTTTDASREIELSTKQQATAVEQVNVAIANVAQTTRETETSSKQTLDTAAQLTHLSKDLTRLVQPQARA